MAKTTKTEEAKLPGIVLYKNDYDLLSLIPESEERWQILGALIDYAIDGDLPDFSGNIPAQMAWMSIKPHLDANGEKYQNKESSTRYAVYCRELKKAGEVPLPYTVWKVKEKELVDIEQYQSVSNDNERSQYKKENKNQYVKKEEKKDGEFEGRRGKQTPSRSEQEQDFEAKREAALQMLLKQNSL